MSIINARYNTKTGQYRCGLFDCNALLAVGDKVDKKLEIKCKCGTMNNIAVVKHKPEGRPFTGQHRRRIKPAK